MSNKRATTANIRLVSHHLCPYVQRVAIVLAEKNLEFERHYIDFERVPAWFKQVSPLGKTPVLLVNELAIFESAVICEFLEDTSHPALHPRDPAQRARHRAWMEFGSSILDDIATLYSTPEKALFRQSQHELQEKFSQLEAIVSGPYFAGNDFCIVDAVFAPVFRYFDVIENCTSVRLFTTNPSLRAWRRALSERASVRNAVQPGFTADLTRFLSSRKSHLATLITAGLKRNHLASPLTSGLLE